MKRQGVAKPAPLRGRIAGCRGPTPVPAVLPPDMRVRLAAAAGAALQALLRAHRQAAVAQRGPGLAEAVRKEKDEA